MSILTQNDARLASLEVAKTYGCMSQYNEMVAFYSNESNAQACYDAYKLYGIPPRNGVDSYGNYHSEWCSWDLGMYKFFLASKLYAKYPTVNILDNNNCKKIGELITSLEKEKLNADKLLLSNQNNIEHSYQIAAITEIQSTLMGAYASLSCATVINQVKQTETLQAISAATAESEAASTGGTQNNIVYIIAAVVIMVVLFKIFKS